jgi:predicted porin
MKKSLLALAVLGAFAGAASAQSSVTMYGRVDLSVGKGLGNAQKGMFNGSGSRLGMRGVEDLGGGLKGLFNIEHRFDADTGASSSATRFWTGRSIVGVEGGFGQIVLGREYTTAFLQSQLAADPWGWDTVVAGTGSAAPTTAPGVCNTTSNCSVTVGITGGGIAKVRNDSSITYKISFAGVTIGAQTAERTDTFTNVPKRPINFAVSYGGGPLAASFGYEQTGASAAATEKWMTGHVSYAFGPVRPGIFIGRGTNAANTKVESLMGTATVGLGAGELRFAFGQRKFNTAGPSAKVTDISGLALGYHHSLSKRTTVYADFARNSKLSAQKTGYDVGLKHNF